MAAPMVIGGGDMQISMQSVLSYPHAYAGNLMFCACASAVTLVVAGLSIWFRRTKGNISPVKKTIRPEGVYYVPNVPICSALCIGAFCVCNIVWCCLAFNLYQFNRVMGLVVIRVITLTLPFWLFLWAHFSSFGAVYACHLFPLDTTSKAMPRLARWLRFRPRVVNAACYLMPWLALVPTFAVAVSWAVEQSDNDSVASRIVKGLSGSDIAGLVTQWVSQEKAMVDQYAAQWAMWAFFFAFSGSVYALYSSLLLPTLANEIRHLKDIGLARESFTLRYSMQSVPVVLKEPEEKEPAADIEQPKRPEHLRRPSWLSRTRLWSSFSGLSCERRSSGNSFSRFDLLRANSRIAAIELAVFLVFCGVWVALSVFKAVEARRVLWYGDWLAATLLVELYAGLAFGFVTCALVCRRGYNATRVEMSPTLAGNIKIEVAKELSFLNLADAKTLVDDDEEKQGRFQPFMSDVGYALPRRVSVMSLGSRRASLVQSLERVPEELFRVPTTMLDLPPPRPAHLEPGRSLWAAPMEWSFDEAQQQRFSVENPRRLSFNAGVTVRRAN